MLWLPDTAMTSSFVNGCEESTTGGHIEAALATMIGARPDPKFEYLLR